MSIRSPLLGLVAMCLVTPLAHARPRVAATPPTPPQPPAAVAAPTPPMPPAPPPGVHAFSFSFGRGRLGVSVTSMTPELRAFFGAPEDSGILVQRIETDTPAAKAGVRVGDVIVQVDAQPITDAAEVAQVLADHAAGDIVEVVVLRSKKRVQLRAELTDDALEGPAWNVVAPPGAGWALQDPAAVQQQLERLDEAMRRLESRLDRVDPKGRTRSEPVAPSAPARPRAPRAKTPPRAP